MWSVKEECYYSEIQNVLTTNLLNMLFTRTISHKDRLNYLLQFTSSFQIQLNSPQDGLNRCDSVLVDPKQEHGHSTTALDEEVRIFIHTENSNIYF